MLGGSANICYEFATKRYRSNCVNWGILPFTLAAGDPFDGAPGDFIYVPRVREKLAAGDLVLNLESYDLACGSKSIHLSYKEFSLAKVLMANAGQVVSKDMLIAKVWGVESSAEDNNVEAYVSFLRKKMKFLGSTARIETLRRAGYRFVADAAPDDASESAGLPC